MLPTDDHGKATRGSALDLAALLGALCLFLSTIEYLFPKPVPFLRIGLANLPILLALGLLPVRHVLLIATLKVVGQGLLHGTFASYVFLFSLSGTMMSTLVMLAAFRLDRLSLVGVSLLGAMASSVTQIALSITFIFGENARMIAPLFLGVGIVGGLLVGVLASGFTSRSQWYARVRSTYR